VSRRLHLGVSLDGAGAHPAARQLPGAATRPLDPARLVRLARTAERGHFDFVSLDDSFDPPTTPTAPFRLDALLALARIAPATTSIGLIATVTTTHTEPFHVSKNVATLDLVSGGRAGWRVAVSTTESAARRFGRKDAQPLDELWAEADDAIEVVTRLWDSWQDDAVVRDRPTGRYLDRDKVHYIDFEGSSFSVRGPSITPRSPQGQPLIAIAANDPASTAVAVARADIILVEGTDIDAVRRRRSELRADIERAGRNPDDVSVLLVAQIGELEVRARLDTLASPAHPAHTLDLVGDATHVAEVLGHWFDTAAVDGFLLQPDALPESLEWLVDGVAPLLRDQGVLPDQRPAATLRDRFGLARPLNRYAHSEATS
jgi:alkanesulfonate monooxygenase SsuD/methylene tetrahydromethanopterin reductase-like flavin-dependent oxidoreductase (luciferase family)